MAFMADEKDRVALVGILDSFEMNLSHKGQVASMARKFRSSARLRTSGETPWAENKSVEPSGTSVK